MSEVKSQGSITKLEKNKPNSKCQKWQLRVSLGKDVKTGKYQRMNRNFNGSYRQAKAAP